MIYSKTCEYAIRALAVLALQEADRYTMIPTISKESGVPRPYLSKIFQTLAKSGILKSHRGPSGGFALTRSATDITLKEVVEAIDNIEEMEECVMGLEECNSQNACPLHFVWVKFKEEIIEKLANCSILDVTHKIRSIGFREMKRTKLKSLSA